MRILHVFDHSLPVQSGYSFRSTAILREQRTRGWQTVHLTSSKHGEFQSLKESSNDLDFYRTPTTVTWWSGLPAMDQFAVVRSMRTRLRDVIEAEKPDIIQAHSPCLTGLAALGLGVPVVYEMRSSWEDAAVSNGQTTEGSLRYRLSRALESYVLRRADAVTTICAGLRADIIARGVAPDNVTIIPNAVDVERFAQRLPTTDARPRYQLQGAAVLGFAGSFFAWEGLPLLIDALAIMLRERGDVRVLLVGSGPDEAAVRAAVERNGVERQVVFAGQVKQRDVDALYDAMDLLVYPRLPMRLTNMVTPLKPLEAMALSKVFLASDVGGHRELIEDGRTGLLFKAGDAQALARAALDILADPDRQRRITTAGLRFVREERTWAHSVAGYEAVYQRLMARQR
jgi:PEP-CTERM/exosortase A-associated glycosyltransferase